MKWPKVPIPIEWCELRKLGWKRRRAVTDCSLTYFYISPCNGFVVKRGYFTCREAPRGAIPTKELAPRETDDNGFRSSWRWVIQPKAKRDSRSLSIACRHDFSVSSGEWPDDHRGNRGMYMGRPVLIDW